jgi:hypothetical protein
LYKILIITTQRWHEGVVGGCQYDCCCRKKIDYIDDSEVFFIFLAIGDRKPRVRDAFRSDLSASLDFFPFFPPKRPPNIPFFFFLVSILSEAWTDADGLDLIEADAAVDKGGSSTSWPVLDTSIPR